MPIPDAQRDNRRAFLGGFAGQLVSGLIWLASSGVATWGSRRAAMLVLIFGGMAIFPLTVALLRLLRNDPTLAKDNPLGALAPAIAFTVPLTIPVALGATAHRAEWFYPALMIIVGAHYLPFVFLYGMPMFAVLGGLMVAGGVALGYSPAAGFAIGGWATGALLVVFAFLGLALARREAARA